jgi:WD40 repeat protein/serine/threonine protein kinase
MAAGPDGTTELAGSSAAGVDSGTVLAGPAGAPAPTSEAEADVAADWKPGDLILDLYEVLEVHTGGAMGVVYRVRHTGWDIELAVKSPRPEFFETEADKQRFEQEARTWVELGLHPHLVACHYVRRLGGIPRVFAEYVAGGSLADWVRERRLYFGGPERTLERILDIAIQFTWGLAYAHERGLVHRDVKPANVMLEPDGQVKVTDFGLAGARVALGEGIDERVADLSPLVSSGGMTPAYCSPEQAEAEAARGAGQQPPALTAATDVWSWAISVLELFVGRPPCPQGGQLADHALLAYRDHGADDTALPAMPDPLADLLARCLRLEPAQRPETLLEISQELSRIYQREVGEPYPRSQPERGPLLSDSLSNQALSMLDLGDEERAGEIFAQALASDPHHPQATYNQGLWLWRKARIADDELIRRLEAVRASHPEAWVDEYLLALAHLERRDPDQARPLLDQAAAAAPDSHEVAAARDAATAAEQPVRCLRTLAGHRDSVAAVALTPDGRLALTASADATARLWELTGGREFPRRVRRAGCLRTLRGHQFSVDAVALTPDGRLALTGGWDHTARLWELSSGRCLRTLEGHAQTVGSVALTADGRLALTGSWDQTARLWELASGRCLRTLEGDSEWGVAVALTPDGRLGVTGGGDGTARLWELASGRCLRTLEGHGGSVAEVALTPDGGLALTGSRDGTARLWELASGRCLRTLEGHHDSVAAVALKADGRLALTGGSDGTARLWDLASGRCLRTLTPHADGDVRSVALTPDARLAVTGGSDPTARLWKLASDLVGHCPFAYSRPRHASDVAQVNAAVRQALTAADRLLARGDHRQAAAQLRSARRAPGYKRHPDVLRRWARAVRGGRRAELLGVFQQQTLKGHSASVSSIALTPDRRIALTGSQDQTARLWELASGRCLRTLESHGGPVAAVALTPDGRLALTGGWDGTARLWELASGRCVRILMPHRDYSVTSVALTADGRLALTGGRSDETARLWELASGRCLRTLKGYNSVEVVALTPDGGLAVTGGGAWGHARVWRLASGDPVRALEGPWASVAAVALTPDGRLALTGIGDGTAQLWELASGRCLRTLEGGGSVALSADGRLALTAGGGWHLWELDSGDCLCTKQGHGPVALTPDGRLAVTGSHGNMVQLWGLEWDYEFPEPADFDEGACPQLELFMAIHYQHSASTAWSDEEFQALLDHLADCGYGWLRPEGVRAELERIRVLASTGGRPRTTPNAPPTWLRRWRLSEAASPPGRTAASSADMSDQRVCRVGPDPRWRFWRRKEMR